ncbi:hypothetical protein DFS34DRAFT_332281 [Phlyctochytrium arcticum]|nr:hypothetical protein DFS34DRAFT_332281 [Phlyctochytrium arcticum]
MSTTTATAPVTFTWPYEGSQVVVTGNFDNWSQSLPLHKEQEDGPFAGTRDFDVGYEIQYKFVVDGRWCIDLAAGIIRDESGNENNVLRVEALSQSEENRDIQLSKADQTVEDMPSQIPESITTHTPELVAAEAASMASNPLSTTTTTKPNNNSSDPAYDDSQMPSFTVRPVNMMEATFAAARAAENIEDVAVGSMSAADHHHEFVAPAKPQRHDSATATNPREVDPESEVTANESSSSENWDADEEDAGVDTTTAQRIPGAYATSQEDDDLDRLRAEDDDSERDLLQPAEDIAETRPRSSIPRYNIEDDAQYTNNAEPSSSGGKDPKRWKWWCSIL